MRAIRTRSTARARTGSGPAVTAVRRVVIIGGGAIGSSIAYHLAARPRFAARSPWWSATRPTRAPRRRCRRARSASNSPRRSTSPCRSSASQFLQSAPEALAVDGDRRRCRCASSPAICSWRATAGADVLRENHAVQRAARRRRRAARSPRELAERFPWLSTRGRRRRLARPVAARAGSTGPALLRGVAPQGARRSACSYVAQPRRSASRARRSGDRRAAGRRRRCWPATSPSTPPAPGRRRVAALAGHRPADPRRASAWCIVRRLPRAAAALPAGDRPHRHLVPARRVSASCAAARPAAASPTRTSRRSRSTRRCSTT